MAKEPILEPALPICDPHHHLMDNDWARYRLDDLLADIGSGHNVVSTVYMECGTGYRTNGPEALRPLGEIDYVLSRPAPAGVMAGIVAYADLRLGEAVEDVLDAYAARAGRRLSGIRFMSAWDADPQFNILPHVPTPGLLGDGSFRQGARAVGRRGLPLDCWMYGHQLGDLVALATALPDQTFVLDHLGSPLVAGPHVAQREAILADWRASLRRLAACPNVSLKLGGLTLHMQGAPWPHGQNPGSMAIADFWQDDVRRCIDSFGPARCMFESNFPIDRMVTDYTTVWNAFKRIAAVYSEPEKRALFHDTAVRTYLGDTAG